MKKYLMATISCLAVLLPVTGFASPITLNLFDKNISILDALLIVSVGLVVIGLSLICIALLKPVKEKKVKVEEEVSLPEALKANEEKASTPVQEEMVEEEDTTEEVVEEKAEEEIEAETEEEEEKIYPKLTLVGINNDDFKVVPLRDKTTMGRRQTNDVIFTDTSVSGEHCVLSVDDEKIYIEDCDSTNGTYINAKKITKEEVKDGDILTMGKLEFKIRVK